MHEFNKIIQESPEPRYVTGWISFFYNAKKYHIVIVNVFSKINKHTHIHIGWYFFIKLLR